MKYVLYEGSGGDMLFTREEHVRANPGLLTPFENKTPTMTIEASDDNEAITKLNGHMMVRGAEKK
jgi:hypothetical protein